MSHGGEEGSSSRAGFRWRYVLAVYAILLLVSHVVRRAGGPDPSLRPDQARVEVLAVDSGRLIDAPVQIAYTVFEPDSAAHPDPATLILLHGSPMASMSMMTLAQALPDSLRRVVPDLPGFGRSTKKIPDYSVEAHGRYLEQLMDALAIQRAHLVAYSMSGGVALHVYDRRPDAVESIVMLSAIGVQELELLGSYRLNHAVHAFQLGVLWAVQELFPHMGFMDDALLNTSYARNFFDSDQRPLRGILERYDRPMLIMHGREDLQVPVEAALEHERIVPQSKLALFDGGHGLVFRPGIRFLETLTGFVEAVEEGAAPTARTASLERRKEARRPFDAEGALKAEGLTLIVYMFFIALATLFSEDATCIGAGLLVAQGNIGFVPATLACFIGIVVGDSLLFFAGRYISGPLLTRRPMRWIISKEALEGASAWLRKRGAIVIVASRFIPGSRVPTYIAAGSLGLSFWTFLLYFTIASVIWTPMLVGISVVFGEQLLTRFLAIYEGYALWIFIALILLIWGMMHLVVPLFTHQGRRMLVGAWRRKVHWEFWPLWVFYLPVIVYIVYLGLRYRSLTLFTSSNPGIDLGGLVGESKTEILDRLSRPDFVARYTSIDATEDEERRVQQVLAFMEQTGLGYPVILKPDVGERGKGVFRAHSREDVENYVAEHPERLIAQEYAAGREFGVFYYRFPSEAQGRIYSITDKRFPKIVGDGKHTLHRLILDDERAVCMARHYFKANHDRLFDVPPNGEEVQLIDIGTHARGAVFLDGEHVKTDALEEAFDLISKGFDGFYFGRFDVRTDSVEAFREGKRFKIVELNGVTSEATHIYDPSNTLLDAYRVLMRQWRIAFEIGDQNRRNGYAPATHWNVLRRILQR